MEDAREKLQLAREEAEKSLSAAFSQQRDLYQIEYLGDPKLQVDFQMFLCGGRRGSCANRYAA